MGFHPWHPANAAFPVLAPERMKEADQGECRDENNALSIHVLVAENKSALITAWDAAPWVEMC